MKHRHVLDETLGLSRPELAIMTLLLLRGPQTPGELKTRSARLYPFGALGEIEGVLARLAGPEHGLVANLPRRPGQKESRWAELLTASDADAAAARVDRAGGRANGRGSASRRGACRSRLRHTRSRRRRRRHSRFRCAIRRPVP